MAVAQGWVAPGYEPIREAFAEAQAKDEGGAQLCVYRHGERVVDLWAGQDPVGRRPYTEHTITTLMSCTKAAVATCAHILEERGLIALDAPVARYWPEFAAAGKEETTVRHLLTHSAGLMGYEPDSGIGARDLLNWQTATEGLASMRPLWEPGTAYFYHFVTFGFVVGEVVRRVSGRTVGKFFAEEVAQPLGIDFWIGLPESQEPRVAPHFSKAPQFTADQWRTMLEGLGVDVGTRLAKTVVHTLEATNEMVVDVMNTRAGRAAEVPAGNGIGNARALAKMYAALIGEVDGVRLIGPATMERARAPQTEGMRAPGDFSKFVRTEPQRFGLGFELPRAPEPMLGSGSFGHAGAGGRLGYAHPESGVAVGYVCNNMLWDNLEPDARWVGWTKALHEVTGA
jgi:CubicO group peptidase (beta-lactamase class C family)